MIGLNCRYRFGPEWHYGWMRLYGKAWSPGAPPTGVQYQLWRI